MRSSSLAARGILSRAGAASVAALLIGVSLFGCQSQPAPAVPAAKAPASAPAAQATTAPAAATVAAPAAVAPAATPATSTAMETIKVGLMLPVTGPAARMGGIGIRLIQMTIDDINAKGGVKVGGKAYKFEAVVADDQNSADLGREAANRLILAEKIKFFLGTWTTPLAGAQAVITSNKVLALAATGTPTSLSSEHPSTFIVIPSSPMRSAAVYAWLTKTYPNAKRVGIIEGDDANGRQTADGIEAQIKANNLTMSSKEFYPMDLKDYDPLVTRTLREKPDVIDVGMGGTKGPLLLGMMKSLNDQGFRGPVLAASADLGALQQGLSFMEGFTVPQLTDAESPMLSAGEKAMAARYIQKFGVKEFEGLLLPQANAPAILAQAMERAGTVDDTTKLAQTIASGEFETVFGKSHFVGAKTFGKPAVLEQPIYLSGVRGGKLTTFASQLGTLP